MNFSRSMSAATHRASPAWLQAVLRHRAWLLIGLTILFVLVVRVRLREIPLERDEGEYAYAGQLMLQGVPPYRDVYTMKLPGTYAAYALIMAVLGQTPSAIHLGLALVNIASIVLVFQIGRKLLDEATATTAAVSFALLSLSPSVLGLAAHATHFLTLAALAGTLVLLNACREESGDRFDASSDRNETGAAKGRFSSIGPHRLPFLAGVFFGLALLMKQHGLFFGVFGFVYLARVRLGEWLASAGSRRRQGGAHRFREPGDRDFNSAAARNGRSRLILDLLWFSAGWVLPLGITCVVLWMTGAFRQFVFWTMAYASQYASAVPIVRGPDVLRASLKAVASPDLVFWIVPWIGGLVMWWDSRLDNDRRQPAGSSRDAGAPYPRFFLMVLLFCSFAAASVGLYFREHYFIVVLPALGLFTGVAVSRGLYLLKHDKTIELFLALPMLGLFGIAVGAALIGHGPVWLTLPVDQSTRSIFGTTLFAEAARVGEYLRTNTPPETRVAVLGSEPEIYFHAHRRAATGQIYMYPLTEETPYASKLQEDMIAEIQRAQPEYLIYVDSPYTWLNRPNSPQKIFEWWKNLWATDLDLVKTAVFQEGLARGTDMDRPPSESPTANQILVFKRRK